MCACVHPLRHLWNQVFDFLFPYKGWSRFASVSASAKQMTWEPADCTSLSSSVFEAVGKVLYNYRYTCIYSCLVLLVWNACIGCSFLYTLAGTGLGRCAEMVCLGPKHWPHVVCQIIHYLENNRLGQETNITTLKHTRSQKWWKVGLGASNPNLWNSKTNIYATEKQQISLACVLQGMQSSVRTHMLTHSFKTWPNAALSTFFHNWRE